MKTYSYFAVPSDADWRPLVGKADVYVWLCGPAGWTEVTAPTKETSTGFALVAVATTSPEVVSNAKSLGTLTKDPPPPPPQLTVQGPPTMAKVEQAWTLSKPRGR